MHGFNSQAASTPVADKRGIYAVWYGADHTQLAAFDLQGKSKWTRNLSPAETRHGPASSPILCGNRVILALEQRTNNKGLQSFWYAVDSEPHFDHLKFYIDDALRGAWSGAVPYTTSAAADPYTVATGWHTFTPPVEEA